LGTWQAAAGDLAHARESLEAAHRADTGYTAPEIALAEIDRRQNRLDDARRRLAAVLGRAPDDIGAMLLAAAIEDQAGDHAAAAARYRDVLARDSGNVIAMNNLGAELATSDPDEALNFAQRALELAPGNPAVQDTLGWIYYRKGIYSTAARYLKSAVEAEPNPRRRYHLALCYLKTGEPRLGAELLRTVMREDPTLVQPGDWQVTNIAPYK